MCPQGLTYMCTCVESAITTTLYKQLYCNRVVTLVAEIKRKQSLILVCLTSLRELHFKVVVRNSPYAGLYIAGDSLTGIQCLRSARYGCTLQNPNCCFSNLFGYYSCMTVLPMLIQGKQWTSGCKSLPLQPMHLFYISIRRRIYILSFSC